MPRRLGAKQVLIACRMAFEGLSNGEIANLLDVTDTTVSNWRRLEVWKDFEADLINAYKEQALENMDFAIPSELHR